MTVQSNALIRINAISGEENERISRGMDSASLSWSVDSCRELIIVCAMTALLIVFMAVAILLILDLDLLTTAFLASGVVLLLTPGATILFHAMHSSNVETIAYTNGAISIHHTFPYFLLKAHESSIVDYLRLLKGERYPFVFRASGVKYTKIEKTEGVFELWIGLVDGTMIAVAHAADEQAIRHIDGFIQSHCL